MKYEYKEIVLSVKGELPQTNKNEKIINDLGKEGWELIAVSPLNQTIVFTSVAITKKIVAYFKREI